MAEKLKKVTIQIRRGTTEEWDLNSNVIPAAGEPCLDLTTGHVKIGDGKTTYQDLPDFTSVLQDALSALAQQREIDVEYMNSVMLELGDRLSAMGVAIREIQAGVNHDVLMEYINQSVASQYQNKEALDGITSEKIARWDDVCDRIPAVSEDDNDKFIIVKNGVLSAVSLQDVSKEGM